MNNQGNVYEKLFDPLVTNQKVKILIIGFNGSGRTSILKHVNLGEIVKLNSLGLNVDQVNYKNILFIDRQIDLNDKLCLLWSHYFNDISGIVFVLDASDRAHLNDAAYQLMRFLTEEEYKNVPLVIMVNKVDLRNSMSGQEVSSEWKLDAIDHRPWILQETTANDGDGIYQGLGMLIEFMKSQRKSCLIRENNRLVLRYRKSNANATKMRC